MRIISRSSGYAGALLLAGTAALAAPAALASAAVPPPSVPCSSSALVAAIQQANTAGPVTLLLSGGCTYALTSAVNASDGLPPITGNVTVIGSGGTTISRAATAGGFRIFDVAPGGRLTLANLTVANGSTDSVGGGVLDQGTLALRGVRLTGNNAVNGGGLFVLGSGRATASSSEFAGNSATNLGGGIQVQGSLALRAVRLTGNKASNGGGLGIGTSGQAGVSFSQFTGNSATGVGGGAIDNAGQLAVDHSTLTGNSANVNGGGLSTEAPGTSRISGTLVAHNRAGGLGGGIANLGRALLTGDRVVFNSGADGGGISNNLNGTITLRFTLVAFNTPDNCHPRGTIRGCRH
jgi:predicted outer membrane repeat protein